MPNPSSLRLHLLPIPAFQDNYVWLLHDGRNAAVVDPGDALPVEAALDRLGLNLTAIVLTHHHRDHTGGVAALVARREAGKLPVFGPAAEAIAGVTDALVESDIAAVPGLGIEFRVIEVPGHTRGHIAYYSDQTPAPLLFCGDTLFACGCGKLFEGTAEQMQSSLAKLAGLPDATLVYCAHEYTLSNLRFAQAVEPHNEDLAARARSDASLRSEHKPTVPSTLALEKMTNPFLRWDIPDVRAAAAHHAPGADQSPVATFAALRAWKDRF